MSQNDSNHTFWEFTSLGSSIRIWPCQPPLCSQGAAVANNLASMRVSKSSWRNIQGSSQSCTFAPLRILQKTLSLLAFSLWLLLFGMSLFIIWYHLMRAGGQHFLCQECYLAYLATPDCHTTCSSAPVWLKSRPSSEAKIADALASMAIHLEAQLGFVMGRTIW